jgi:UDP-N-acetylglucosamine acyltransferase
MSRIHPTAIVDPKAELDSSVEVGPYSIIGPNVRIGAGTVVGPHVVIEGHTTIGKDNKFFQFSSIGAAPQDKKWAGEPTRLKSATATPSASSAPSTPAPCRTGVTRLGNDNWISAYVHLAHDCQVGSNTIFSNNAQLAGHVDVGDWAILSGYAGVHQFCKIGAHAFVGMYTSLTQDVPPFVLVNGNPAAGARRQHRRPEAARLHARADQRHPRRLQDHLPFRPDAGRSQGALREGRSAGRPTRRSIRAMRDFLGTATRGIVR